VRRRRRVHVVRVGARRELALVVGFSLAVMVLIGLGAAFASRSVAQAQALADSERMTQRLADLVVGPLLPQYLAKDPKGVEDLDTTVRNRMSDGYLTEVVVWSGDGEVLYSDKTEYVGLRPQPTPPDVPAAIAGTVSSGFQIDPADNAAAPSAEQQGGPPRYVEVYAPMHVRGLPPMAFEAYYDYHSVDQVAQRLLRQTLPLVVVPLLLLQLIQIPAALSLARRLKRHEDERARLLERALSASDRERVRFSADLHDGPIQDLAGISYALGAVAPTVPGQHASLMARVQEGLQRSIQSLRGLMTDLYPPDLASGTLDEALLTATSELQTEGIEVTLDLAPVGKLSPDTVAALYRVARETLANVAKHAAAQAVTVSLTLVEPSRPGEDALVRLEVADDGVGVEPTRLDRRIDGHLGLRLLADRVDALGGQLTVISAPGQGTTVRADLPAIPADSSEPVDA
jgi:two-component system NarL family sensor kinase